MKNRLFTILLLMLLALVPLAQAELVVNKYTTDFTAESPYNEQLKLCGCETKVDRIIVENTGNFHSEYTVSVRSGYPGKIRISESGFALAPKHLKEILVYIEDSCGLEGTFEYDVVVRSNYGRVESIERTINVGSCQNTHLTVTPQERTVGLCQPAGFDVLVENVGTYPDTYMLDFGQFNGAAGAERTSFHLRPGESYDQEIAFTLDCRTYGEFTIPFTVLTESLGDTAHAERLLTVTNDYEFHLQLDTGANVCARAATRIPFTITNDAPVQDEIRLDVAGPAFVTIDGGREATVLLDAGETREMALVAEPGQAGEHIVSLGARDVYGGTEKTRDIRLDVDNCYAPAAELRIDETTPAPDEYTACCGPKTFHVNVRNQGDREQVFRISLEGPSFFVLGETTVRVMPSQEINVPLIAELPCTDERYEVSVEVSPIEQEEIVARDTLVVESQTQRTCHMVQIDDDELFVRTTENVLPVLVKHTGIEGGNYTLTIDDTLFTISEENIQLSPGEQQAIHLVPKVNLSEQELGRYISQPIFTLQPLGIDYVEHIGVDLAGRSVWQRLSDAIASLPWHAMNACIWLLMILFVVLVVLLVILVLVYAGKFTLFGNGLSRGTLKIIKGTLMALAVLLLLALLLLPTPGRTEQFERLADGQNATVIEWYQNEEITIDLDQYFEDPDRDDLVYTASQPRNVRVTIEENLMTLAPDPGWAGENTFIVTASDRKGGLADSPLFLLKVIPEKDFGLLGWLGLWCGQISTGLLIGVVLALLLITFTVRERRHDDPSRNVLVVVPKEGATRRYVASKTGKKAHKADCPAMKTVSKNDVVEYKSKAAVLNAGLSLCSICHDVKARQPTTRKARTSGASSAPARANVLATRPERKMGELVTEQQAAQERQQSPIQQTVNIVVPGSAPEEIVFVGSKTGNSVHRPDCVFAHRIPKKNRAAYTSKQEALGAGLVPCKVCRPF